MDVDIARVSDRVSRSLRRENLVIAWPQRRGQGPQDRNENEARQYDYQCVAHI